MKVFIYILWLIIFLLFIKKISFFKDKYLNLKKIYFLFIIKIIISFVVVGIYTYYYHERKNSDIFKYYDDAIILHNSFYSNKSDFLKMLTGINDNDEHLNIYYNKMNFWIKPYQFEIINENKTLIRINALLMFVSYNNYFVNVLFFVFLSFIGLFAMYKTLSQFLNTNQTLFAFLIFLTPSTLFWSSAILKEALILFFLGFSIYFLNSYFNNRKISRLLLFILFYILLFPSKSYIFLISIPAFSTLITLHFKPKLNKILTFAIIHILFFFLFFFSEYFLPYDFSQITVTKQHNFIKMAEQYNAGSKIQIPILENSIKSFILNTPQALINSFLRPFIWEAHNPLAILAAIENVLVIAYITLLIFFFKKVQLNNWILFSFSFSTSLLILIGLTTPVLGAIVRYKIPALPFVIFAIFSFFNFEKFTYNFKNIWKKQF